MYDLTHFDLEDMVRCGSDLRTQGVGATHMEPVAQAIVNHLYHHLRDGSDGPRACALVRLYKTHSFTDLEPELRQRVRAALPDEPVAAMKCLTLLATAGDEPAWNDRRSSAGHQAIPLISTAQIDELPMVTQLIRQFGLESASLLNLDPALMLDLELRTYNVFHVQEALNSPHIPAQTGFVIPYKIASVLGFGGVLPSGELVAVLLFSKVPIPAGTAEFFKTVALNIKVALLPHDGAGVFAPKNNGVALLTQIENFQVAALTQLLDVQEQTALVQTGRLKAKNQELELTLQQLHAAQGQLVAKERLASLGALTAGIAHEIKNPLNFVTNFAQLSTDLVAEFADELGALSHHLDDDTRDNLEDLLDSLKTNTQKIREHGKRADGIVSTMLMHSRGEVARSYPADLNELLKRYTDLAYHGLRAHDSSLMLTIQTDLDPAVGQVDLIAEHMSRVILNLVNNACYAANQRKTTAGPGFTPTVRVSSHAQGNMVEIRVRDNGVGIPAAIRDRIFDPFFTTKPPGAGTGLGLSLSHDIVVGEHQGEMRVESTEGESTEFLITIPKKAPGKWTPGQT